ncbi:MAG: phosphodiester glycosidase family protein [Beijerinckiaceae bacterium]
MRAARLIACQTVAAIAMAWACAPAFASAACATRTSEERGYLVCSYPRGADIRTFFADPDGEPFGTFTSLSDALAARGERLVFAMNGGMYHPDYKPVGLYVEGGVQQKSVNQRAGAGNFGMKPNGVFYVLRNGEAGVMETSRFLSRRMNVAYATQSGPMLVIDGKLHPRIREDGTSRKIRNGVAVCGDGQTRFAISNEPVTFFEFATLFSDTLNCNNALYLDGSISAVYAPAVGRHDRWRPMGPIVGVVEKRR